MRKFLSLSHSAKLVMLIESEYAIKGLGDAEFAVYATQKLGFEVTRTQITNRRDDLGIVASRDAARVAPDLLAFSERLESIERQLAADQKEFRGLATMFLEFRQRLQVLEQAAE